MCSGWLFWTEFVSLYLNLLLKLNSSIGRLCTIKSLYFPKRKAEFCLGVIESTIKFNSEAVELFPSSIKALGNEWAESKKKKKNSRGKFSDEYKEKNHNITTPADVILAVSRLLKGGAIGQLLGAGPKEAPKGRGRNSRKSELEANFRKWYSWWVSENLSTHPQDMKCFTWNNWSHTLWAYILVSSPNHS